MSFLKTLGKLVTVATAALSLAEAIQGFRNSPDDQSDLPPNTNGNKKAESRK